MIEVYKYVRGYPQYTYLYLNMFTLVPEVGQWSSNLKKMITHGVDSFAYQRAKPSFNALTNYLDVDFIRYNDFF